MGFGGTAAPAKLSATLGRGLPGAKGGGGLPPHKRRAALRRGAQTRAGGAPCHRSAAHLAGVDAALQAEHGPMQLDESPNVCEHDGHEPLEEQSYYISRYQVSTNNGSGRDSTPPSSGRREHERRGGDRSFGGGVRPSALAVARLLPERCLLRPRLRPRSGRAVCSFVCTKRFFTFEDSNHDCAPSHMAAVSLIAR